MANVDTNTLCSETDIVNMLEFLIDNIFAMFGRFIQPMPTFWKIGIER